MNPFAFIAFLSILILCSANCPQIEDGDFAWPETPAGETVTADCPAGSEGTVTRVCGEDSVWGAPISDCVTLRCEADTDEQGYVWNESDALTDVSQECLGAQIGLAHRFCNETGFWEEPEYDCQPACPASSAGGVSWPKTLLSTLVSLACPAGYSGTIRRQCSAQGVWEEPDNSACSRHICYDDQRDGLTWGATLSLETITVACPTTFSGTVSRACDADGVWQDPDYSACSKLHCPAETVADYAWPETEANTAATLSCAEGSGTVSRYCDSEGSWTAPVASCELGSCAEEEDTEGNVWPVTPVHSTASLACPTGFTGTIERTCLISGQTQYWGDAVNSCDRIYCSEVVEEGLMWPATPSMEDVVLDCPAGFSGNYTRYCTPSGTFTEVENYCERLVCAPMEDEHGSWPATPSGSDASTPCPVHYHGGYKRLCNLDGEWEDVRDECEIDSCPEEDLDGVHYPATPLDSSVTVPCARGYTGTVTRACSASVEWLSPEASCTRNICPLVCESGLCFPETYESETVTLPCTDGSGGVYERTCSYSGEWESIHDRCTPAPCTIDVQYTRDGSCVNVQYPEPSGVAVVTMLPGVTPVVSQASSVRICDLQTLTSYSLTVELCDGTPDNYSCGSQVCTLKNVYNAKGCKQPAAPVLREVSHLNSQYSASVAFVMDSCSDGQPEGYEVRTQCVSEGCEVPEAIDTYVCGHGGVSCVKGSVQAVTVSLPDLAGLQYAVSVRYYTSDEGATVSGPYSDSVAVVASPSTAPAAPASLATRPASLNSILLSWSAPAISNNAAIYNFKVRVLRFVEGARRLSEEGILERVLDVCEGVVVCEARSLLISDLVPNTAYTFEVFAISSPSNEFSSPVASISVRTVSAPSVVLSVEPADWYALLRVESNIPMTGTCSVSRDKGLQSQVLEVQSGSVSTISGLSPSQAYNVYCLFDHEAGVLSSSVSFRTVAHKSCTLATALSSVASRTASISVSATKPGNVYCAALPPEMGTPSAYLLKQQPALAVVDSATYYVALSLSISNVFCYYEDTHGIPMTNSIASTLLSVHDNDDVYVPVLLSVSPANNAEGVDAEIEYVYTFERDVVKGATSFAHYFILSNLADSSDVSYIYMENVRVEGASVYVKLPVLSPSTSYSIQYSASSVLSDKFTGGVLSEPGSSTLRYFSTRSFSPIVSTVVVPAESEVLDVNRAFVIRFNQYVSFSDGYVDVALKDTTESVRLGSDSPCLFLRQGVESSELTIDYPSCMGVLRMNATYHLLVSYGLIRNQQGLRNEPVAVTFSTSSNAVPLVLLSVLPKDGDEEVPTDSDVVLSFNQPIEASQGSLFFEEIEPSLQTVVRKFNVEARDAVVSNKFPYSLTFPASTFSLRPSMEYRIYWSASVAQTINEPRVSSEAVGQSAAVSFFTAKFACSAKSLAENMSNMCSCKSVNRACVCSCGDVYAQYSP